MKTLLLKLILVTATFGFAAHVAASDRQLVALPNDFRILGGELSHQGRHARISVGEWKILYIKLYEYTTLTNKQ